MFSTLKIRHKVWLGFAVLLLILAAISLQTLKSLDSVDQSVAEMVQVRQPAALLSKELSTSIHQTASALGFFLSTKEDQHREGFLQGLKQSEALLSRLREHQAVANDEPSATLVEELATDLQRFRSLGDRLLETATTYEKNFPGIAYANAELNPLSRIMVQLTSQMIASEQEEETTFERRTILTLLSDLRYAWSNVMNSIRGYLAFRSEAVSNDLALYLERTEQLLGKLTEYEYDLTLDQADSLEQFNGHLATYKANIKQMMQIHGGDQWRTDAWLVRSEASPLFQKIDHKLQTLEQRQAEAISRTNDAVLDETAGTTNMVAILLLLGLAIGLLMSWLIGRSISRPLCEVAHALNDIAHGEGDLTRRLESHSRDEIGQLAESFNTFIEKIQTLVQHTARATAGVISAVDETTRSSDHITQRILTQEAETEQVATAIQQMAATISEVADNAANASEATRLATEETSNGHRTVEETARSIQALQQEISAAADIISQVEKNSEGIGSVLDVIKGIAEQTNLLALNAAIEAARAGEQGRGFAVVADEVRNLANRTQQSAGEIEEMIKSLQGNTRQAVSAIDGGCRTAEQNVGQANSARASLDAITTAIETINAMNLQIARASEQQSTVSEEINRSIVSISQGSKDAASLAEQSLNSTGHLGKLASELQQIVQQFKISSEGGERALAASGDAARTGTPETPDTAEDPERETQQTAG